MAKLLRIPVFVVFDADTDRTGEEEALHKKDNKAILSILGYENDDIWPGMSLWKNDLAMWSVNLGELVRTEIGPKWKEHFDSACAYYANAKELKKNPLTISRALESSWNSGLVSGSLVQVVDHIVEHAKGAIAGGNVTAAGKTRAQSTKPV